MLDIISKMDSAVVKALLLAMVGLLGSFAGFFGISEDVFNANAAKIVSGIALTLTAFSVFYAMYARITKPNPPLSQTALDKRVKMEAEGTLKVIENPNQPNALAGNRSRV